MLTRTRITPPRSCPPAKMPTVTTTVTSAASCGKTTTVTTTEATPELVSAAAGGAVAAAAEPAAKPILKDGIDINASHWPKAGVPVGPGDITAEWFTTVFQSRGLIGMSTVRACHLSQY